MVDFIRRTASTYFHPTSTCRMGPAADCVVDHELVVYGVGGLRVADASLMAAVTSGNTTAPSIMIGEKLAALIIGRVSPSHVPFTSVPTASGE